MRLHLSRFALFFIPLVVIIAGCKSSEQISPPVELPEAFSESGTELVPEQWWMSFQDDGLNAAIAAGVESNFTLLSAFERLQAAQAVADQSGAAGYPDLEASAQGRIQRDNDEFSNENGQIELGLSSVYEVDLWGRIRSGVQAEAFRAQASLYDFQTAALTLTGKITSSWYQLAEASEQLALLEEQTETNETVLQLLRNRFRIGQIDRVDVVRQQQLVEATREQQIDAEARQAGLENQLAVLLGRPPQEELNFVSDGFPELPPLPEAGLPAELIQRRPDVQTVLDGIQ